MNKYFLSLTSTFFCIFTAILGDEIRIYKDSDYPYLKEMICNNPELLLPGNDHQQQVEATAKFFGSKNYTTLVDVIDEKPVGFITYQKALSTWWLIRWITRSGGAFQLLSVEKEYQRRGIGNKLIQAAIADMKTQGFQSITLQTKTANTAARALYEKNGFTLAMGAPGMDDCFYKRAL